MSNIRIYLLASLILCSLSAFSMEKISEEKKEITITINEEQSQKQDSSTSSGYQEEKRETTSYLLCTIL